MKAIILVLLVSGAILWVGAMVRGGVSRDGYSQALAISYAARGM